MFPIKPVIHNLTSRKTSAFFLPYNNNSNNNNNYYNNNNNKNNNNKISKVKFSIIKE